MNNKQFEETYGVTTNYRQMPNGEVRLGLLATDGSSYTRTVSYVGAWQNSHYHNDYQEIYVVQKGKVLLATMTNDSKVHITAYQAGQYFVVTQKQAHNIYQFADTVTHNIKFGGSTPEDWHAVSDLDELVTAIDISELSL